jgi:hypothetical protein
LGAHSIFGQQRLTQSFELIENKIAAGSNHESGNGLWLLMREALCRIRAKWLKGFDLAIVTCEEALTDEHFLKSIGDTFMRIAGYHASCNNGSTMFDIEKFIKQTSQIADYCAANLSVQSDCEWATASLLVARSSWTLARLSLSSLHLRS